MSAISAPSQGVFIHADQVGRNKLAQECSNHRLSMTSCENRYATAHEHGDPVETIYTFKCSGSCGMVATLSIQNQKKP